MKHCLKSWQWRAPCDHGSLIRIHDWLCCSQCDKAGTIRCQVLYGPTLYWPVGKIEAGGRSFRSRCTVVNQILSTPISPPSEIQQIFWSSLRLRVTFDTSALNSLGLQIVSLSSRPENQGKQRKRMKEGLFNHISLVSSSPNAKDKLLPHFTHDPSAIQVPNQSIHISNYLDRDRL